MGMRVSILRKLISGNYTFKSAFELGEENPNEPIAAERMFLRGGYEVFMRGSLMDNDFLEFNYIKGLVECANATGHLDEEVLI